MSLVNKICSHFVTFNVRKKYTKKQLKNLLLSFILSHEIAIDKQVRRNPSQCKKSIANDISIWELKSFEKKKRGERIQRIQENFGRIYGILEQHWRGWFTVLSFMQRKYFLFSRSSCTEVFLRKGILKKCSKFTGEHAYRTVISVKLQSKGWMFSNKFAACFQNTFS